MTHSDTYCDQSASGFCPDTKTHDNSDDYSEDGAQGRDRTTDTAIFSRMLYQLSYLGVPENRFSAGRGAYREAGRACPDAFHAYFTPVSKIVSRLREELAKTWQLIGGPARTGVVKSHGGAWFNH